MIRILASVAALLVLSGCGDPDETRATPESEAQDKAEPAVGENRPDVINRTEPDDKPSELSGVPLEPALEEDVERDPAYVGVWAPNLDWCDNTSGDEVPIQLTEDTFGGYENSCEITKRTETGHLQWETDLTCTAEGRTENRRITLAVEGNRMDVVYHEIGDQRISYYRCLPETGRSD
jgi:hypothetical protein